MLHYMFLLQLIVLVLLQGLVTVFGGNYRVSYEIHDISYLIDANGKYTMKEAQLECKKENSNLIIPHGSYDYKPLRNHIEEVFDKYDSFWTYSDVKDISYSANIDIFNHVQQQCNYFDRTFRYLPTDCDTKMGFICAKPLKKGVLKFNVTNEIYMTQSAKEYNCQEAHAKCADLQMSLITYDQFVGNIVLQNVITTYYGKPSKFWLGDNENCATSYRDKVDRLDLTTKLGFICEKRLDKLSVLSNRHLVLIAMVCFVAVFGLIVLCAMKCFFRKVKSHTYETDIPEPLKNNYTMSI